METTRKHPRSLVEAFGPYAHGSQLHTEYDAMPAADKIVLAVALAGFVAVGIMALLGWLPWGVA